MRIIETEKKLPFFNLQDLLDEYSIEWETQSVILCINAIRNIGKTTGTLAWVLPQVNKDNKVVFIRNNEEQLKTFKQDFNASQSGKFVIKGSLVWSLKLVIFRDKDDQEMEKYEINEHVGYIASISTYTKIKSVKSAGIRFVVMDEYNEMDTHINKIYFKFINMFKTFERFNKVLVIMLGNRDTPNNEFMVNWGVIPQDKHFYNDYCVRFSKRGYFIELGKDRFNDLKNEDTLANELAQFNQDTKRYLDGGYGDQMVYQVVPFDKIILPSFNAYFKFAIKGEVVVFGEFVHWKYPNEYSYCLVRNEKALEIANNEKLETYSLDSLSYQLKESRLNTSDSIEGMVLKLFRKHKQGRLYYDSFDILQDIIDKMVSIRF